MLGGYAQRSTTDYDNSAQSSYEAVSPGQAWTYDVAADRWQLLAVWPADRDEKQGPWPCGRFYGYVARYSPPLAQVDANDRVWMIGRQAVWTMSVDAGRGDDAGGAKLAAPANQRRYREGMFLASYCEVPDAPKDTALDNLPANKFVRLPDPPRNVCYGARSRVWGTAVWDGDRDEILVWGGGHCVRSENPPIHYSPASGRMVEGYDAQEAYTYGGAYGTTTVGRPWVPGHSWNGYAYDTRAKLLVTGWGHLYDPARMDWLVDSSFATPFAAGYNNILESSRHGVVAWGRAGSWNSDRCGLWLFDAAARQWSELLKPGPGNPVPSADGCAMAYDPKRDRMLLYPAPWAAPGDGTIYAFNFSDRKLEKLTPAHPTLGKIFRAREMVYVDHADWMLFGSPYVSEGDEPGQRKLLRAYDPQANRWLLLDIEGIPDGHLLSHGWMYDAARKLVYVADVNAWRVWALRLDVQTVKVLTAPPKPRR